MWGGRSNGGGGGGGGGFSSSGTRGAGGGSGSGSGAAGPAKDADIDECLSVRQLPLPLNAGMSCRDDIDLLFGNDMIQELRRRGRFPQELVHFAWAAVA